MKQKQDHDREVAQIQSQLNALTTTTTNALSEAAAREAKQKADYEAQIQRINETHNQEATQLRNSLISLQWEQAFTKTKTRNEMRDEVRAEVQTQYAEHIRNLQAAKDKERAEALRQQASALEAYYNQEIQKRIEQEEYSAAESLEAAKAEGIEKLKAEQERSAQLTKALNDEKARVSLLQGVEQQAQKEKEKMDKLLKEKTESITKLTREKSEVEKQLAEKNTQLQQTQTRLIAQLSQIRERDEAIQNHERELEELRAQSAESDQQRQLEQQIETEKHEKEQANQEVERLRAEKEEQETQIAHLRETQEQQEREAQRLLQEQKEDYESQLANLGRQKDIIVEQLNQEKRSREAIQLIADDRERIITDTQNQIQGLRDEFSEQRQQLERDITKARDDQAKTTREITRLRQQMESTKKKKDDEIKKLKEEKTTNEARVRELNEAQRTHDLVVQRMREEAEREKRQLEAGIAQLNRQIEQLRPDSARIRQLEEQEQTNTERINELQRQKQELESQKEQASERIRQLQEQAAADIRGLEHRVRQLNLQISELRNDQTQQQRIHELEEEQTRLKARITELEQQQKPEPESQSIFQRMNIFGSKKPNPQLVQLEEQAREKDATIQRLQNRIQELDATEARYKQEAEEKKRQLERTVHDKEQKEREAASHAKQLEDRIKTLEDSEQKLQRQLAASQTTATGLQQQLETSRRVANALQNKANQLDQLRREKQALQREKEEAERAVQKAKEDTAAEKNKVIAQLRADAETLRTQTANLRRTKNAEISNLQRALRESQQTRNQLQTELTNLQTTTQQQINGLQQQLQHAEETNAQQLHTIEEAERATQEKTQQITELEARSREQEAHIAELNQTIEQKDAEHERAIEEVRQRETDLLTANQRLIEEAEQFRREYQTQLGIVRDLTTRLQETTQQLLELNQARTLLEQKNQELNQARATVKEQKAKRLTGLEWLIPNRDRVKQRAISAEEERQTQIAFDLALNRLRERNRTKRKGKGEGGGGGDGGGDGVPATSAEPEDDDKWKWGEKAKKPLNNISLNQFLKEMESKGTEEEFEDMKQRLIDQKAISFRNMSNDARRRFLEGGYLHDAIAEIMSRAEDSVIYIKAAVDGKWATLQKQLHPNEFEAWMDKTFVGENGKFYIDYQDREYYHLTDGDRTHAVPAFVFDQLQIVIAKGKHKRGVAFSKWYYTGDNEELKRWLRERYQIADHPPTPRDTDLMIPCAIHAILLNPMSETERTKIKDYLYSRQRTRFLQLSSLKTFAEEMDTQLEIYGIDGNLMEKYSAHGIKKSDPNPNGMFYGFDKASLKSSKNGILFQKKEGRTFLDKPPEKGKYYVKCIKLVYWDDHLFIYDETTPFRGRSSPQLISALIKKGRFKPINLLERNVFSLMLPLDYIPESLYYAPTYLAEPEFVKKQDEESLKPEENKLLTGITLRNLEKKVDKIDEKFLPTVGFRLFLSELIAQKLNVLADSGSLKYFLRQSIQGANFRIADRSIVEGGITMLDRNSNHPYSLSQIDFPLESPKQYPTKNCSTREQLFRQPIFCIDCDVEYVPQHPLDHVGYRKRMIINSIDARNPAYHIIQIYRGYYWDKVAHKPLEHMIQYLYGLRQKHPKIKKIMNSMYGKMIQKSNRITIHPAKNDGRPLRTNPLIRSLDEKGDLIIYQYYNDTDFKFNFTMIASLLLAQQRENMRQVFVFCQKNHIPMYYSAADSIAIPTKDIHYFEEAGMIGNRLGQFKVEAQSDVGVFVKKGLYYCGMGKIITSLGSEVDTVILPRYAAQHGMTVEELFRSIVKGKEYTIYLPDGRPRVLRRWRAEQEPNAELEEEFDFDFITEETEEDTEE